MLRDMLRRDRSKQQTHLVDETSRDRSRDLPLQKLRQTIFRPQNQILLLHDDFKKHPHVRLGRLGIKLFRSCFIGCRVRLAITDRDQSVP